MLFTRRQLETLLAMEALEIDACKEVLTLASDARIHGPGRPEGRILGSYQIHPYFAAVHARLDLAQARTGILQQRLAETPE